MALWPKGSTINPSPESSNDSEKGGHYYRSLFQWSQGIKKSSSLGCWISWWWCRNLGLCSRRMHCRWIKRWSSIQLWLLLNKKVSPMIGNIGYSPWESIRGETNNAHSYSKSKPIYAPIRFRIRAFSLSLSLNETIMKEEVSAPYYGFLEVNAFHIWEMSLQNLISIMIVLS